MRKVRASTISLHCLMLVLPDRVLAVSCVGASAAAQVRPAGWTTHNDARGFAVDMPPGWSFSSDVRAGRILVQGPRGEQIVVWPASMQQKLDARGAAALVLQLARQVDGQMPWGTASAASGAVRTIAKSPQRSGVAVMRWSNEPNGSSIALYCVEAPTSSYPAEQDTFAAILRSFRVVSDAPAPATVANSRTAAASGPITYVTWTDPYEGAYSLSVPQGWKVVGGAHRLAATDVRSGVTLASPDGQIRVILGDTRLGTFIGPTPMMAYAGMREGTYYRLGDGSQLLIRRYVDGQQFARDYVHVYVSPECSGVQMISNNARADLSSALGEKARAEGMPNVRLAAGDASFTCSISGTPVRGMIVAATLAIPQSTMWYAYRLYGYLAAPGREQDAERVVEQSVQSIRINPQWLGRQQQIANNAVAADTARSQQFQHETQQAIARDEQQTSDMIMKGWQERSQTYDEIARRRENAILGTVDVVDPSTGQRYKIDNYSDYHWMNNSGVIAGNNTGDAPGPDWHRLTTLP